MAAAAASLGLTITRLTVAEFGKFNATVSALNAARAKDGGRLFVLVCGDTDPATGLSWCPDCRKAEPFIYKELNELKGTTHLLLAPVQKGYRNGDPVTKAPHPYVAHPLLGLKGVPTLYKWSAAEDKPSGVMTDPALFDAAKIREYLNSN